MTLDGVVDKACVYTMKGGLNVGRGHMSGYISNFLWLMVKIDISSILHSSFQVEFERVVNEEVKNPLRAQSNMVYNCKK